MLRKDQLGSLEHSILLAVLCCKNRNLNPYALNLQKELAVEDLHVTLGALYVTLTRMEEKGWVSSVLVEEATTNRGGRPKRCYSVSASGIVALSEAHNRFRRMAASLEPGLLLS